MRVETRRGAVLVEGYVCATARDSGPIGCGKRAFVEQIAPGAFAAALERNPSPALMACHRDMVPAERMELREDSIGLYAAALVTCPEVRARAEKGLLRGWSFGFIAMRERTERRPKGPPRRIVEEMELLEISIIDERSVPAYSGTSIKAEVRALAEAAPPPVLKCGGCGRGAPGEEWQRRLEKLKGDGK